VTQLNYRAGGARGETARGSSAEKNDEDVKTSKRFETATSAMLGATGVTTEPVVEQIGQLWELDGPEVRSVQKWNCAARKTTPRSKARKRSLWALLNIRLPKMKLRQEGLRGQGLVARLGRCSNGDARWEYQADGREMQLCKMSRWTGLRAGGYNGWRSGTSKQVWERKLFEPMTNL
jgi:hypothetical protein